MIRLRPQWIAAVALLVMPTLATARTPAETLESANDVLTELQKVPEKAVPAAMLADAEAVAIVPRVVKAGFVVGGRLGHGLVVLRTADGGWTEPKFIRLTGASVGFQAGVESTDVVLVFKTKKSLERLLDGKRKLTLGADAAVAAGPLGRAAKAGTDGKLQAEIYSYSRSRGLFAGVSLEGATLVLDAERNREFERDRSEATKKSVASLIVQIAEAASPTTKSSSGTLPPPAVPSNPPPTIRDRP